MKSVLRAPRGTMSISASWAWVRVHVRAAASPRAAKSSHSSAPANSSGRSAMVRSWSSPRVRAVTALKEVGAPTCMHSREDELIGSTRSASSRRPSSFFRKQCARPTGT